MERSGDGAATSAMGRRTVLASAASGAVGLALGVTLGGERSASASAPPGVTTTRIRNQLRDEILAFGSAADTIYARHWAQSADDVVRLREKYREPVFGSVDPVDLVDELARCIDPTDSTLAAVSQHVHLQQIIAGMEGDGVDDEDMYLAAMTHDLGKVLLLTDEDPANVVCGNRPIGEYAPGIGLDNVVFQWNHDEFIWERMGDLVPDPVAWLMRYHSIEIEPSRPLMDERDLEYLERWLVPFRRYDFGTKSTHSFDPAAVDRWKPLVRERLPRSVMI